jgi:hypothetical protein
VALVVAAPAVARDEFKAERKRAVKAMKTAEGQAYLSSMLNAIGQDLGNLLKTCVATHQSDNPVAIEIVLTVKYQGKLAAVLVNPSNELSKCLAYGFTEFTFPDPGEKFAERGMPVLLPVAFK